MLENLKSNLSTDESNVEFCNFSQVDETIQVQLFTGLDLIYALPPGGKQGQVLVKNSDKAQDVSWQNISVTPEQPTEQTVIKHQPLQFVENAEKLFECLIPSPHKLIDVKDNNHNSILYESLVTDNGIKIIVETNFEGYAIIY